MAFELELIAGSTTYSLSDGAPYKLVGATGLGMASVQRFARRYPGQDGYDDLGHVLEPRTVTLALSFNAADASTLDGYRDDLARMFVPGSNSPLVLQITRDDGEVRRLDVVTTGLTIDTDLTHRPGNLHRAAVQLRAADPIWYAPTAGTVTFGTVPFDWWTANGIIGNQYVLEHVGTPAIGQAWNWGTASQEHPDHPGRYELTVAFYGGIPTPSTVDYKIAYGFNVEGTVSFATWWGLGQYLEYPASSYTDSQIFAMNVDTSGRLIYRQPQLGTVYNGGTHSFVMRYSRYEREFFVDGAFVSDDSLNRDYGTPGWKVDAGSAHWRDFISGTLNPWYGGSWPESMTYAATYNKALSDAEILVLAQAMAGTTPAYALGATVSYGGNYDEYPIITLTGPLSDPVVTNITADRKLDFTGATVPAGVTYTIDLSRDTLSVVDQGGTIHTDELTEDSDLGNWVLQAGQSNYVYVTAATSGTASAAQIVYRNRFVSY